MVSVQDYLNRVSDRVEGINSGTIHWCFPRELEYCCSETVLDYGRLFGAGRAALKKWPSSSFRLHCRGPGKQKNVYTTESTVIVTDRDGVVVLRAPATIHGDAQGEQILTTIFSLATEQTAKVLYLI